MAIERANIDLGPLKAANVPVFFIVGKFLLKLVHHHIDKLPH